MEFSISGPRNYANYGYETQDAQQTSVKKRFPVIQTATDTLAVVQTKVLAESAEILSADAAALPGMPNHTPDEAGAILIFHTEDGDFILGELCNNAALTNAKTVRGKAFPKQINATIGGYIDDPALPLKKSIMSAIKNELFLSSEGSRDAKEFQARELLDVLCRTIKCDDGWEDKVCVQAGKYADRDGIEEKTCYLTAVKHIRCARSDLTKIENALDIVAATQVERGDGDEQDAAPTAIPRLEFFPFDSIVDNSLASYREDELAKAQNAYEQRTTATLNDLPVATLALSDAFRHSQYAHLSLPDDGAPAASPKKAQKPGELTAHAHGAPGNVRPSETIGQQIERLRLEHGIQLKFKNLVKVTVDSLKRASDAIEKKLVIDQFILSCHDFLSLTDDEFICSLIQSDGQALLGLLDPSFLTHPLRSNNKKT